MKLFTPLLFVCLVIATPAWAQLDDQTLFIAKEGQGLVTTRPAGVICGLGCEAASGEYDFGDFVEVRALPSLGWRLQTFTGECSGVDRCDVIMNSTRTVGVIFVREGGGDPPDDPDDPPPPPPDDDPPIEPEPEDPVPLPPIVDLILSEE